MKLFFPVGVPLMLCMALTFFSCAGLPSQKPEASMLFPEMPPEIPEDVSTVPKQGIPEQPRPMPPENIMGKGMVPREKLAAFLLGNNPRAKEDFIHNLSGYYIEEASAEGINHDMAFAQMCLETGFLRYGGLVTPDMNNFCGLGAIGPEQPGLIFADARSGVRAHIQHLQAYASTEPLNQELIDPRYRYVKRGSSPTIYGLAGTWATDRAYSGKIGGILERLYEFAF